MKVKDLIEALEEFDPEDEVHLSYNYGDHWRTTVAPKVRGVEYHPVKFSDYHRMPKLVDLYDEEGEFPNEEHDDMVVVLS